MKKLDYDSLNVKHDLKTLIEQQNLQITEIKPLARLDAPNHPTASFRIQLSDRRVFKGRLAWNEARAKRIHYFLNILQSSGFPVVYGRYRSALLLEWVSGTVLSHLQEEMNMKPIAEFQGKLHSFNLLTDCPFPQTTDLTSFTLKIDKGMAKLSEASVLDRDEMEKIDNLVQKYRPLETEVGMIHTDICPQNLVLDDKGRLRSIDNESLQIGWPDLDLARTWYRWPLDAEKGRYFLDCYRQFRNPDSFICHAPFWFLAVLLDSVVYRLGSPTQAWETPLIRLKNFLSHPKLI